MSVITMPASTKNSRPAPELPSPREIARRAAEIRDTWSLAERRRRARIATHLQAIAFDCFVVPCAKAS